MSAQPDSSALQGELALVIQSPEFMRSPVLRRLLEYLVAQTLAGNGKRLKAYQIAVEGLGRDDSFDPQSDSYPRVQVGRLRKMLDMHYAVLPPGQARARQRIAIPLGHYDVQLLPIVPRPPESALNEGTLNEGTLNQGTLNEGTRPDRTGPDSAGPDSIGPDGSGGYTRAADARLPEGALPAGGKAFATRHLRPAVQPAHPPTAPASPAQQLDRGWLLWVVSVLLMTALIYIIWLLARPDPAKQDAGVRDIHTQVAHITIATDPPLGNDDLNTAAQIAEMHLQRFEMLAVSMGGRDVLPPSDRTVREYQLVLRGGARPAGAQGSGPIFLTLRHAASGTTLWSRVLSQTEDGGPPDIERAIGAGISDIARSGGLIAQHQRKLIGNDMSAGYPCLIQYDGFRQRRDPALRAPLGACLKASLAAYPNEPLILQAMSYLALSMPQRDRRTPLVASAEGRRLADAALQYDSRSSLAQIAVARSSVARGNCPRAIAFARRAVESNPMEPDTLGLAGTFLMSCGDYTGAESVLERAMAMNSESGGFQTSSLIITLLVNGREEAALDLAMRSDSQEMAAQPNFLLAKALALAANGRTAAARSTWGLLERSVGVAPGTPVADVLAKFTLSPRFTRQMQAQTQRVGLAPAAG